MGRDRRAPRPGTATCARSYEGWSRAGFSSQLFDIARTLVRAADELPKPNDERLREYTDAALPALKQQLFSKAPIYQEFETCRC